MSVEGTLAAHLARSLRMRAGDVLTAVDGAGHEHGVSLDAVTPTRVEGAVTWTREATGEPVLRITVVQALPRDRFEDCIDVLVEVGVAEIRPVITQRVVARPGGDRVRRRLLRWQAIATESAQLAGRGIIPQVHAPTGLAAALTSLEGDAQLIVCTFDGERSIAAVDLDRSRQVALCIGPEGGFGDVDMAALRDAKAQTVHMGARVLRTRYAGAVACALLLARSGDLDVPISAPLS